MSFSRFKKVVRRTLQITFSVLFLSLFLSQIVCNRIYAVSNVLDSPDKFRRKRTRMTFAFVRWFRPIFDDIDRAPPASRRRYSFETSSPRIFRKLRSRRRASARSLARRNDKFPRSHSTRPSRDFPDLRIRESSARHEDPRREIMERSRTRRSFYFSVSTFARRISPALIPQFLHVSFFQFHSSATIAPHHISLSLFLSNRNFETFSAFSAPEEMSGRDDRLRFGRAGERRGSVPPRLSRSRFSSAGESATRFRTESCCGGECRRAARGPLQPVAGVPGR